MLYEFKVLILYFAKWYRFLHLFSAMKPLFIFQLLLWFFFRYSATFEIVCLVKNDNDLHASNVRFGSEAEVLRSHYIFLLFPIFKTIGEICGGKTIDFRGFTTGYILAGASQGYFECFINQANALRVWVNWPIATLVRGLESWEASEEIAGQTPANK